MFVAQELEGNADPHFLLAIRLNNYYAESTALQRKKENGCATDRHTLRLLFVLREIWRLERVLAT